MTATPESEAPQQVDLTTVLEQLAEMGRNADPDNPVPFLSGAFAFYATPDGAIMAVTTIPEPSEFAGTHHHRIAPGMIRAALALMSGGSPLSKAKNALGIGRRGR